MGHSHKSGSRNNGPISSVPVHHRLRLFCFLVASWQIAVINGEKAPSAALIRCCFNSASDGLRQARGLVCHCKPANISQLNDARALSGHSASARALVGLRPSWPSGICCGRFVHSTTVNDVLSKSVGCSQEAEHILLIEEVAFFLI